MAEDFSNLSDDDLEERMFQAMFRPEYKEARALIEEYERRLAILAAERPSDPNPLHLAPPDAARFPVGSLARLVEAVGTPGGTTIPQGTQVLVVRHELDAFRSVTLTLQTADGLRFTTGARFLDPLGWG